MNDADIKANIEGRKSAQEALEQIAVLANSLNKKAATRFWEVIMMECIAHCNHTKTEVPMDDEESIQFGQTTLEFGQHRGKSIDSLPLEYLEWITDTQIKFSRQLKRYLQSRRIMLEDR